MAARSPEFRKYQAELGKLSADAFPKAIAETLTTVASFAHAEQIKTMRKKMIVRNKYSEGSMQFWAAHAKKDINKINAVTGSRSAYLPKQEEGATIAPKDDALAIATDYARGGSIRNVVKKRYRMREIGPLAGKGRSTKSIYFMLPSGIYYRKGSAGRKKKVGRRRALIMVRSFVKKAVRIPANRWHTESVARYAKQATIEAEFIRQAKLLINK